MRLPHILGLACSLALAVPSASSAGSGATLPTIKFEKYRLSNGLEVILHEDRSTPIVTTNVWYHVGSKNERPGRTGFAHLFEHMMFQGSKHWNDDYFKPLQEAGGVVNGSTNSDRTNYFEIVPANFLERALYLEADRLGFLLDAMTQERLDNQRDVVKNERRQRYENVPYGTSLELMAEGAFPKGHPYSWLTIGSMEDLSAASMDDVKDFFRRFYTPNNATLVVAGDFQAAEAKTLIEKHFGALPPGPPVASFERWVPKIEGEKRLVMQDRVQLPRVSLLWHTTPIFTPGDSALDVLAYALARGKTSRLYQALVHKQQIAQDVTAYQDSREIAGTFQIVATARPGHTAAELEKAVLAELALVKEEGIDSAEIKRIQNTIEADFVRDLQSIGGNGSVSDKLNMYNHYLGDPGYFQKDLDRYMNLKPADVRDAARRYLGPDRVVLTVSPMPAYSAMDTPLAKGVEREKMPGPGPVPSLSVPKLQRETLANGLSLVVAEHHELPVLEVRLVVGAGSAADPATRPGLANLTAQMLDEGTSSRASVDLARELDSIGATLALSTDVDTSAIAMAALKKHGDAALSLLADVVMNPDFPADELERVKKQMVTRLLQDKDRAEVISARAISRVLYGEEHPYAHPEVGDEASLTALGRDDLRGFWKDNWRPENATLLVVGDITLAEARTMAEKALGSWPRGSGAPSAKVPDRSGPTSRTVYLIDKPGAAQSVIAVSQMGLPRNTPDYFPAMLMNAAFGGMFSSRLNMKLREEKGYTYGARSAFDYRRSAGPFTSGASVQTKSTRESIDETLLELDALRGGRPIADTELEYARNFLVRNFAQRFETPGQIADQFRTLVVHGLPDDFYATWIGKVQAVTADEINRFAASRITSAATAIVVVGDAAVIKPGLIELGGGKVQMLDVTGRPLR